jgi:hypothetical protein
MSEVMYPDLLGNFIMTLIEKGYRVSIYRDSINDMVTFYIIKYGDVPYHAARTITFDELSFMAKDIQKIWFDNFIEWAEAEFKKVSI